MLINHGEKVRRAVLLSTLPSYTEIQHRWLDALLTLRSADVDPLVQSVIGMPWGFTPPILADHEAAFRAAQAIRVYDSRPRLPEVRVPTLVLAGAEDVLTPVHQAVEIARLIPGADLTVLPRGGHAMPSSIRRPPPAQSVPSWGRSRCRLLEDARSSGAASPPPEVCQRCHTNPGMPDSTVVNQIDAGLKLRAVLR